MVAECPLLPPRLQVDEYGVGAAIYCMATASGFHDAKYLTWGPYAMGDVDSSPRSIQAATEDCLDELAKFHEDLSAKKILPSTLELIVPPLMPQLFARLLPLCADMMRCQPGERFTWSDALAHPAFYAQCTPAMIEEYKVEQRTLEPARIERYNDGFTARLQLIEEERSTGALRDAVEAQLQDAMDAELQDAVGAQLQDAADAQLQDAMDAELQDAMDAELPDAMEAAEKQV